LIYQERNNVSTKEFGDDNTINTIGISIYLYLPLSINTKSISINTVVSETSNTIDKDLPATTTGNNNADSTTDEAKTVEKKEEVKVQLDDIDEVSIYLTSI
jgi:hypothetical protein